MIYFICAFEAEARALIDHYRLHKEPDQPYPVFLNSEIIILISGMGQQNAEQATRYLLVHYPTTKDDILINLGICAAQETFPIGTLLHVTSLRSEAESFEWTASDSALTQVSCFSALQALDKSVETDIAEMEAISIYNAASTSFPPSRISVLKIVSDHFKPFKIQKQFIIDLIRPHLQEIDAHIKKIQGETDDR